MCAPAEGSDITHEQARAHARSNYMHIDLCTLARTRYCVHTYTWMWRARVCSARALARFVKISKTPSATARAGLCASRVCVVYVSCPPQQRIICSGFCACCSSVFVCTFRFVCSACCCSTRPRGCCHAGRPATSSHTIMLCTTTAACELEDRKARACGSYRSQYVRYIKRMAHTPGPARIDT